MYVILSNCLLLSSLLTLLMDSRLRVSLVYASDSNSDIMATYTHNSSASTMLNAQSLKFNSTYSIAVHLLVHPRRHRYPLQLDIICSNQCTCLLFSTTIFALSFSLSIEKAIASIQDSVNRYLEPPNHTPIPEQSIVIAIQ